MEPLSTLTPAEAEAARKAEEATRALAARFDAREEAARLEPLNASQILEWAFEQFGEDMYIACSFQKTSSVVMHLATEINPDARFFYIDTDFLFPETYETRDRLAEHFNVEFERWHNISPEEQAEQFGDQLWKKDPDACCGIRKVDPMARALASGVDCWVAGIRREDSATRAGSPKFMWDRKFKIWKLNPIADWSERDVWTHLHKNGIPYNPLHDQGYPSIGCTHCTLPVHPGQSSRDGRWSGSGKTECGIN
ncbi:MAG: phosphoadenylyl-sulfate reductase [Solirubrobacterales bacterium]|nr:phosphoadenylyl-sulfate reductase [Solirubrobacterales bacterium]